MAFASLAVWPAAAQPIQTVRLECENAVGNRLHYSGHPSTPKDALNKLVKAEDKIAGLRLEIVFQFSGDRTVAITQHGNQNIGGRVTTLSATRLDHPDYVSFVRIDPEDNSTFMMAYFPLVGKLAWSIHASQIMVCHRMALTKQFLLDCRQR